MPKKPSEFDKLKAQWYKKLEKSGFADIENSDHMLKVYSSAMFSKAHRQNGGWEAKASYYQMCDLFLNEYEFENRRERIIWEYHANAISFRDIAITLKKARVASLTKDAVYRVVKRLEHLMKVRYLVGYAEKHNDQ